MRTSLLASLVLVVLSTACGGDGGPDAEPEPDAAGAGPDARTFDIPDFTQPFEFEERHVSPMALDAATDLFPAVEHYAYIATDRPLRDELVVFFPGTMGQPSGFTNLELMATFAGYRTIGLAYVNDTHQQEDCVAAQIFDLECFEANRLEKIDGIDRGPSTTITRANSIEHRLIRVLQALATQYPTEGWDVYLDGTVIQWDRIVVAGFSQGSGMASMLARDHLVARAVLFGNGGDYAANQVAPWCLDDRATPPSRTFGLSHERDTFDVANAIYAAIGLDSSGDWADADTMDPPYDGTHMLSTNLNSEQGDNSFHLSIATDQQMPVDDDGIPLLAADQYYLFTYAD